MTSNEFKITRNLFIEYTNYSKPLSYEEWLAIADDYKTAVLYCQFFEQITLAWYKLASVYSTEQDGVDEVLQYLNKNVELIKNDRKRFTPSYIYKVAYNCLYCLCRDPNRYKRVFENERSNITYSGDEELDLFDTVVSNDGGFDDASKDAKRSRFWSIIEEAGDDTIIVVNKLLGEDLDWRESNKKANGSYRKFTKRDFDKITPEKEAAIMLELRSLLAEYADVLM